MTGNNHFRIDFFHLLNGSFDNGFANIADEMKAAFEYAESNYQCYIDDPVRNRCKIADPREMDLEVRIHFLELLHAALDSAGETVFGQRIQTILDELTPIESILPEIKDCQGKNFLDFR